MVEIAPVFNQKLWAIIVKKDLLVIKYNIYYNIGVIMLDKAHLKMFTILIVAIMGYSSVIVSADMISSEGNNGINEIIEVKVAIYTRTETIKNSVLTSNYNFRFSLTNYSWKVGNKTYRFMISYLTLEDLQNKRLTTDNFDMVLNHWLAAVSFNRNREERIIEKNAFNEFIEQGGGYYGSCAASMITGEMTNFPVTSAENSWKKRMLGISGLEIDLQMFCPIHYMLMPIPKDPTGHYEPYWIYHGLKSENGLSNKSSQCGVPIDFDINKDHAIFDDFIGSIRRMQWYDAPLLNIPDEPDREIDVLATFPDEELSENESTQLHYWRYTGGLKGIIKCLLNRQKSGLTGLRLYIEVFSEDWEPTETVIPTDLANKPYITSEVYPNENKARIVSSPGHPEAPIWWGGHIVEVDTDHDNLYNGFFSWENVTSYEETPEDEYTYNYCLIRRFVAWVAKVPDNDLPPVYGESEVCDFENNIDSDVFNITGNCKVSNNDTSLDLYYRYSVDNVNWTTWAFFDTDNDISDGWSWNFNSPNGSGYYEFYSIKHIDFGEYEEFENVPPGADACVFVGVD